MYASWGVDYLKYDWCNTEGADPKQRYDAMRDALHAAGRPIVFSMCEWGTVKPWTWAKDMAICGARPATSPIAGTAKSGGRSGVKHMLDLQVGLENYAGPGHWNDPDMLEVGNTGTHRRRVESPLQLVVHARRAADGRQRRPQDDAGDPRRPNRPGRDCHRSGSARQAGLPRVAGEGLRDLGQ